MNNRAFTLIELMLVIAVLGIVLGLLFPSVMAVWRTFQAQERETMAQDRLFATFRLMHAAFAASGSLDWVRPDRLSLAGPQGRSSLVIQSNGQGIRWERTVGTVDVDVPRGLHLGPFEQVDSRTVRQVLEIHDIRFPMYWRTGP